MKLKTLLRLLPLTLGFTEATLANSIGYIEDFALSPDRSETLRDLIPGTRDFYYYHALHAQNRGSHLDVERMLSAWTKRYGETSRVREIRNRQALLTYDKNPSKSLAYLMDRLRLRFNHSRLVEGRKPAHPTKLDPKDVSYEWFYQNAVKEKNMQGFEQRGLRNVDASKLNAVLLQDFLKRLVYPDVPNLTKLIHMDLRDPKSRGFGSLQIHRNLTKTQLEELLELDPKLLSSNLFVQSYLSRLRPSADIDTEAETAEKTNWLNRQILFVRTLSPAFNSLKANVLYNFLAHKRSLGDWDREMLMEYLALPRPVSYLRKEWIQSQMKEPGARPVNFNEDFINYGCYPPIRQDLPLVRSMLLHFFKEDANFDSFSKFLTDQFLKPIFAEAKLTAGKGDAERWFSMLSTGQLKSLKERTDLSFAPDNGRSFAPDEKVNLKIWTKNIDKLMVKEFEINAFNYYLKHGKEVSTAIELDGLSATRERLIESDLPPIRRNLRTVSFPDLKKRGTYVVEFIGNGISSRALVRKGALRLLGKIGPAGHEFKILDESNRLKENATLWLNGKEYSPKNGVILIPFSNEPGNRTVILRDGDFASLARFAHLGENYSLKVGFHVDRESLRAGEKASLLIRPSLRINGFPTSLKLLEDCKLVLITFDHDNQPTRMEVPIDQLDSTKEYVHEFRVPERMQRLQAFLEAKVENLSAAKTIDLKDGFSITINGMDHGNEVAIPLLHRSASGFVLEVRGKNGEPLVDYSMPLTFKHVDFRRTRTHTLKTDREGRVGLGLLANIEWIQAQVANPRKWMLEKLARGRSTLPTLLHAIQGETLTLPFPRLGNRFKANEFSLFEKRSGGDFAFDHSDKIRSMPGLIALAGLPAGEFELHHHPSSHSLRIRVIKGEKKSGFAVSPNHILERTYGAPLSIASIRPENQKLVIRLSNALPSARLHVFGTAYLPPFDAYRLLQTDPMPSPSSMDFSPPQTRYVEERDIGEEYRYVLERQSMSKFPGNLLARPGLILNPWSVRKTETGMKEAESGKDYQDLLEAADQIRPAAINAIDGIQGGLRDQANLDFLAHGTLLQSNLRPNEDGEISVEIPAGKGYRMLRLIALDPIRQASLDIPLPDSQTLRRELRMATDLNMDTAYAKKKQVTKLIAEEGFRIDDFTTARFRAIDSLKDAYDLLVTLNSNSQFREFEFLLDWPNLEKEEKSEKYRTHACHELHFFLYRKDPNFFDEVIKPYLKNKKEPTFVDDWLLQNDLSKYLEPIRFDLLNAFEKALLSTTRFASAREISRHLSDKTEMAPPDLDRFDRLFETALQSSSMETKGGDFQQLDRVAAKAKSAMKNMAFRRTASVAAAPVPLSEGLRLNSSMDGRGESAQSEIIKKLSLDESADFVDASVSLKGSMAPNAQLEAESFASEAFYPLESSLGLRAQARTFYRKTGEVMEWAESDYHKVTRANARNPGLVPHHSFWSDYALHLASGKKGPFLSGNLIYATKNPTEMLLALGVLDLPFDPQETETEIDGRSVTLEPKQGLLLFHEQLSPSEKAKKSEVLISQRHYRLDSRYRYEKGERIDNFTDEEFLPGIPYGSIVVLTNPSSSRRKLRLLLHLPNGSLPLNRTKTVRSIPITLDAYSTQTFESSFYFPEKGVFEMYPARASAGGQSVASAPSVSFKVVEELSEKDKSSWAWISQNGTDRDVLDYLKANNLNRADLSKIAFRLRKKSEGGSGKAFYDSLLQLLENRYHYHSTLWSYSLYHQDMDRFKPFLAKSSLASQCGLWIDSPLLKLDPTDRGWYEQLEYAPLVHARAHRLGKERRILNNRLHAQYLKLLEVLKYKPTLDQQDHLALCYYLFAQDRIEEGLAHFDQVEKEQVREKLQYDYFAVNAAFYRLELRKAEEIAKRYERFGIDRWRTLFAEARAHLSEAKAGLDPKIIDEEDRNQQMDQLADTEPTFSFEFLGDQIRIEHSNIERARIRFYPMEVELLFSRQPFAKNDAEHFTLVSPDGEESLEIAEGEKRTTYRLPENYRRQNVMIEIEAGGKRKAQAYYSNRLNAEVSEEYGRVRVLDKISGKPIPTVYVKAYARMNNGQVRFYKDGYTDLRGKFEYASLNTDDLNQVSRFALLIIDPQAGAQIEEVAPPTR